MELSPEQVRKFHAQGFLVIPGAMSADQVHTLREATARVLDSAEREADELGGGVFTTDEHERCKSVDRWLLESGDKVRAFYEKDVPATDGTPGIARVCKIGHALHTDVPEFAALNQGLAPLCKALQYKAPAVAQSMLILKQPGVGSAVTPHQDGTFLHTTPQSVLGVWWALEDATLTNGCLWGVPGSHTAGVSRVFQRTAADPERTEMVPPDAPALSTEGAEPLEMAAGDAVLLHSAVVHFSEANTSPTSRWAYSVHLVETSPDTAWDSNNWLQRPGGFAPLYREGTAE